MNANAKKAFDMGEYYADFDESTDCWGVFHTETSFCYALFATPEQADEYAETKNKG